MGMLDEMRKLQTKRLIRACVSVLTREQIKQYKKESYLADPNNNQNKINNGPIRELISVGVEQMEKANFKMPHV